MYIMMYYSTLFLATIAKTSDYKYLRVITGYCSESNSSLLSEERIAYLYRTGDTLDRVRGRNYTGIPYVTIWYQDDFRKEYSPEFIKEMEIQEKVWQFKLLFKKLDS